ncbi:hypothetical protein LTR16_011804, partial [Cryomyces antarcticus]
ASTPRRGEARSRASRALMTHMRHRSRPTWWSIWNRATCGLQCTRSCFFWRPRACWISC